MYCLSVYMYRKLRQFRLGFIFAKLCEKPSRNGEIITGVHVQCRLIMLQSRFLNIANMHLKEMLAKMSEFTVFVNTSPTYGPAHEIVVPIEYA